MGRWFDKLSLLLTLAVVVLAPLPFGSIETIWIIPWCFLLGVALAANGLRQVRRVHLSLLAPVLAVALLFALVVWLQTLSPPLIGRPNPIWREAGDILGFPLAPRIAASVPAPWMSLGIPMGTLLAFLCGFLNSIEPRGSIRLVRAVAISGAVFAAYGILSLLLDPTALLWKQRLAYLGTATGTFVNRNTAATYFGTCTVLWLALGWTQAQRHLPRGATALSELMAMLARRPPRQVLTAVAGFLVCLVALLLTLSRAGILLTLAAMVITGGLLARRRLARTARPLLAIGLVGAIAAVLVEFLAGGVAYRVGAQGLVDVGRLDAYSSTLAMIRHFPLLGTGLGTFPAVFQAYRSAATGTMGTWNHAHNTPLEIAAELGLPVAAAMSLLCLFILAMLVRGSIIRRRDTIFPASAAGICFLGLAHSAVDFSLLIPGYAIVFSALIGCGLAQSVPSAAARPQPETAPLRVEREEEASSIVAAPHPEPVL